MGKPKSTVKEFGDDPNLYAVVVDPKVPSTWEYPIFDAEQVSEAIDKLTYGDGLDEPKLLPEQKQAALDKIANRIPKLNTEDRYKAMLLDRLSYCKDCMMRDSQIADSGSMDMPDESAVGEMERVSLSDSFVSEMGNDNLPEVPFSDGVDYDKLVAGDTDPKFVTLAIAEVGKVSKNGILYDEYLVSEIEKQIKSKKAGGTLGHIADDKRDTEFPVPDGLWVGALRVGKVLYGKAYILDASVKEYVKKLDAVKGALGTSIYGTGKRRIENGVQTLTNFNLEQLDFAPPDRASLYLDKGLSVTSETAKGTNYISIVGDTTGITSGTTTSTSGTGTAVTLPYVTSESTKTIPSDDVVKENKEMADNVVVTPVNKIEAVTPEIKEKIIAEYKAANADNERIAELEYKVEKGVTHIAELEKQVAEYQARDFDHQIDSVIAETMKWETPDEDSKVALTKLRSNFKKTVIAELNGSLDAAKLQRVAGRVYDEDFETLAETVQRGLTGPAAAVGGSDKRSIQESLLDEAKVLLKGEK